MPPKRGDKKQALDSSPSSSVFRPATPNDFRIVATVKSLQGLVNTEHKWKVRLNDAMRSETLVHAKIKRLKSLVEQCNKGIKSLEADLDALVDDQLGQVSLDPSVNAAWKDGIADDPAKKDEKAGGKGGKKDDKGGKKGAAAANAKEAANQQAQQGNNAGPNAKDGGGAASDAPPPDASSLPAAFWDLRRKQRDALKAIVSAYFTLPRLARERRQVQRPSSSLDMQHELDEACRLATPASELQSLGLPHASTPDPRQSGSGGANNNSSKPSAAQQKKDGGKPPKAGPGGKKSAKQSVQMMDEDLGPELDPYLLTGDLRPQDFLGLPIPRGLDGRLMHKVLVLRSRRLRLESSIALFEQEMLPLQERLRGIADMEHLGQYSIAAVQPDIAAVTEEEAALQRIRAQEDEAFQRAAQKAMPTSPPSRGGGAKRQQQQAASEGA